MHWWYFRNKATGEVIAAAEAARYRGDRSFKEISREEFLEHSLQIKTDRIATLEKALREAEAENKLIMKMVKEFSCFICCWPMLSEEEAKEAINMAATLDNRIEDALATLTPEAKP